MGQLVSALEIRIEYTPLELRHLADRPVRPRLDSPAAKPHTTPAEAVRLPRLPPEVLLTILQFALPDLEPKHWPYRSRLIRTLVLADRRACRPIQKELFRHVAVRTRRQLERLLAVLNKRLDLAKEVQTVRVHIHNYFQEDTGLERLFALCPNITRASLSQIGMLDVAALASLNKLERLELYGCTFAPPSPYAPPVVFPSLTHLAVMSAPADWQATFKLAGCLALTTLATDTPVILPPSLRQRLQAVMTPAVAGKVEWGPLRECLVVTKGRGGSGASGVADWQLLCPAVEVLDLSQLRVAQARQALQQTHEHREACPSAKRILLSEWHVTTLQVEHQTLTSAGAQVSLVAPRPVRPGLVVDGRFEAEVAVAEFFALADRVVADKMERDEAAEVMDYLLEIRGVVVKVEIEETLEENLIP